MIRWRVWAFDRIEAEIPPLPTSSLQALYFPAEDILAIKLYAELVKNPRNSE